MGSAIAARFVTTGDEADVARDQTVFAHVAPNMTRLGKSGAGQTVKLTNQVLCAANFMAVAETTRLALDGGVDAMRIPAALAGGRADSATMQEYMARKDLESAQAY